MPRSERPLDAEDSALGRFAAGLRRLRDKAGTPTYRELAGRVNYSVAALSTAASGRRVPSLVVTLAYVRGCGGDVEEWRERWHALVAEIAAERSAGPEEEREPGERAPYLGLAAFQAAQADRFFGRDRVVEELADLAARRRFTGVFGASGSGKSSVLRAGLAARAGRGGSPVVVLTPGACPVEEFAVALAGPTGRSAPALRAELAADPAHARLLIRQAMADRPSDVDLLLVVDQFEEVFTLCRAEDEREWLIDALVAAASGPTSRARVVIGVRADFYGHCARYPALVDALRGAQVLVGPMTPEDLRETITRPAAAAGCMVEAALVSRLVADAVGRPSVLPLVSHALLETWRRRSGATLTVAGYEAAGGIEHAVARTAETVYTALTERQREIARRLFVRLTALGEGTEDTKRRVDLAEVDTGEDDAAVLEVLAAARLLTIDRETVEITHEALIRNWPRLSDWLAEDRDGLRVHRELTEAAKAWESVDRDPGALHRGTRLTLADDWARDHGGALNPAEREFLAASLAARAREQAAVRRRTRRLQQFAGLLAVLLLLAAGAIVVAVRAENTATERRDTALARKAVGDAAAIRATNPALSVQLSLAAYRLAPMPETRDGLLSTLATPYAARITAHTDRVYSASYSEDGRLLATASADRTVRLWDVANPFQPRQLGTIGDNTGAARFRPGGRVLATAGADRTVRLWDLADPARPRRLTVLTGHTSNVTAVSFSRDGRLLATGGETVRLWDLTNLRAPREVGAVPVSAGSVRSAELSPDGSLLALTGPDHGTALWNVRDPAQPRRMSTVDGQSRSAFSPDGRLLATADDRDYSPNLWEVSDPERPRRVSVLAGHTAAVTTLRFSPDGKLLATAGDDNTVLLWDVTDPARAPRIAALAGHTNTVYALAFSPDGSTLASGGGDRTLRLTDLAALPLADHADTVVSAAFSADGRMIATAGMDRTVRLLDAADPLRPRPLATIRQPDAMFTAEFSRDGRSLITASRDRTARLWDLADPARPRELSVLTGHTAAVSRAVLSPDGRLAATASWDGTVRLWDLADRSRPRLLGVAAGHSGGADAVAFSPDGRLLGTGAEDGVLRLWDVADPGHPRLVSAGTGHADSIGRLAFSPDGRHLATGSNDHTVRLWDFSDPRSPRTTAVVGGHSDAVYGVAFSPDGRRLVTGGQDRTVRLWDVGDPGKPVDQGVLSGHSDGVTGAAFSPDGRFVLTASSDHTVRLWETSPERAAARACALGYPRISRAEWDASFPELDYRPPCP
ncbi:MULTISPECIES: nSTAND1 domain-containing NTPase [Amycolatopsis]|uniref:HTH cro/C1-type domain-containing protein n=3 Tax=Amycolatopsis TaxID=1813 RepID=A0ABW5HXA8_9PSEU